MKSYFIKIALIFLFSAVHTNQLWGQDMSDVNINATQVSGSVYILEGRGGNIGLSVGPDGVVVIDDQFAPLSDKILTAIKEISSAPLSYVVNTHFHGDHTGGNQNLAQAGATIIAHENVRRRLQLPRRDGSLLPEKAYPVITFNDRLNVYLNGEPLAIFHAANAHTDGDVLLYFTQSNVLHTGDTFFNGGYPFIDLNSGGSIDGYIAAVSRAILLLDDNSKIIPGHGAVASKAEYAVFLNMLKEIRAQVKTAIDAGKSLEEVAQDSSLTQTYDAQGFGDGFISSKRMRETVYKSLTN